jgi:hypothetical protein
MSGYFAQLGERVKAAAMDMPAPRLERFVASAPEVPAPAPVARPLPRTADVKPVRQPAAAPVPMVANPGGANAVPRARRDPAEDPVGPAVVLPVPLSEPASDVPRAEGSAEAPVPAGPPVQTAPDVQPPRSSDRQVKEPPAVPPEVSPPERPSPAPLPDDGAATLHREPREMTPEDHIALFEQYIEALNRPDPVDPPPPPREVQQVTPAFPDPRATADTPPLPPAAQTLEIGQIVVEVASPDRPALQRPAPAARRTVPRPGRLRGFHGLGQL